MSINESMDSNGSKKITIDDIIYTGPAYGIYSKFEDLVIGQVITRDIAKNIPITWDMLGGDSGE